MRVALLVRRVEFVLATGLATPENARQLAVWWLILVSSPFVYASFAKRLSLSLSGTFCVFVSMRSAKSDDSNSLCERFDGLLFEAEFRRSRLKKKGSVYLRES